MKPFRRVRRPRVSSDKTTGGVEMNRHGFLSATVIALGIAIAGMAIGWGFIEGRKVNRYVTVKGFSEREVPADLAIWSVTFTVTANALADSQTGIEAGRKQVGDFLTAAGFETSEISHSAPSIRDLEIEERYRRDAKPPYRYIAQGTVTVRTGKVALVRATMERTGELIGAGIVLASENWSTPTQFMFTRLNDIKPEMIEEATRGAREAAERFAQDSGSQVGKIRSASQGIFSIDDRDRNSPEIKKVRVVTTVEYSLTD